jgi:hypothetical protein
LSNDLVDQGDNEVEDGITHQGQAPHVGAVVEVRLRGDNGCRGGAEARHEVKGVSAPGEGGDHELRGEVPLLDAMGLDVPSDDDWLVHVVSGLSVE